MISTARARKRAFVVLVCLTAALLDACGGGGGGSDKSGGSQLPPGSYTATLRPGQRTPTRTPTLQPGQSTPTRTATLRPGAPTWTPTPTVLPFVVAGSDIGATIRQVPPGSTVVVRPGVYAAIVLKEGDLQGSLTLVADSTGQLTGSVPASVTIAAGRSDAAAIDLDTQSGVTIDGFTTRGGTVAAIKVSRGFGNVVKNCIITGAASDAVRFEASDDGLIFDNLLFNNAGAGIAVMGSDGVRVINNTVYKNTRVGISVGAGNGGQPSGNTLVRNNIISKNGRTGPLGVAVETGTLSFDADYNFNTDGYVGAQPGFHEVNDPLNDPLFVSPGTPDGFRLQRSLAGSGTSPAVDSGDPGTASDLLAQLAARSTSLDGTPDQLPPDIGYHYPAAQPTPTVKR